MARHGSRVSAAVLLGRRGRAYIIEEYQQQTKIDAMRLNSEHNITLVAIGGYSSDDVIGY